MNKDSHSIFTHCPSSIKINLNDRLANAPAEVEYEPDNNGFYLENKELCMRYTQHTCLGRDHFDLWFLGIYPKIMVGGSSIAMKRLPKSAYCTNITAHTGDTYSFSFPLDGSIGDTICISRFSSSRETLPGEEEWYNIGTSLLQQAAQKYDVREWYKHYQNHGEQNVSHSERKKIWKRIFSLIK